VIKMTRHEHIDDIKRRLGEAGHALLELNGLGHKAKLEIAEDMDSMIVGHTTSGYLELTLLARANEMATEGT